MTVLQPRSEDELIGIVTDAIADGRRLELRGGGSKAPFGAPRESDLVDLRGFTGIVDYDPPELVITVRAGTPLVEVLEAVAARGQMLSFDPWEAGALFGGGGRATIGGAVAAAAAGPLRVSGGAARDHLLGFTAISGRGERFIAGAKVVKNVTGYDLSKLMAGSWGRLAAMTELTLKVMPRPPLTQTLTLRGLDLPAAIAAMSAGLTSSAEVAAAAHLPNGLDSAGAGEAVTLFQLRGVEPSVRAREIYLADRLKSWGPAAPLQQAEAAWDMVRTVSPLAGCDTLWRVILPPSRVPQMLAALPQGTEHIVDWGGNLLWIGGTTETEEVRDAAAGIGGHAMLVRAPDRMRAVVPAFHPLAPAVARLEGRVRRAFDPHGIFENGRFPVTDDAD